MENQSITQTEHVEPLEARDERYIRNRELILIIETSKKEYFVRIGVIIIK